MNSEPNHKDDRLSSWKEVADYLDSKPRTCIRWEKNLGLPIHRLEGTPRSRIFAYKHELDAWLRTKLRNGAAPGGPAKRARKPGVPRWVVFVAPLVLLLASVAFYVLRPRPTAPAPAVPASTDGVPRSTGVLDIYPGDIITTEFLPDGKLRVWRRKNATTFFESWRMAPLRHTSFAFGDLDGDADIEVVAPGYCREFPESGDRTASTIRFFLNVYKRGVRDWWITSFYDKTQCVYEAEDFEFTDIAVGDVNPYRPGNEIALVTAQGLSIHGYDGAEKALKLLGSRTSFMDQAALHVRAVELADLDGEPGLEILLLGNEWRNGLEVDNRAWLVILKWTGGRLDVVKTVDVDANVSAQALRIGDVLPGGGPEAVFPIYRKAGGALNIALTGWNFFQGFVFETPIGRDEDEPYAPVHLDVGDIMDRAGEEIVLAKSEPNELVCCYWNGAQLVVGPKYVLTPKAALAGVSVSPAGDPGNKLGRIVAYGSVKAPGKAGSFYVEVVDYGGGFVPVWLQAGGEDADIKVSYAAFGK